MSGEEEADIKYAHEVKLFSQTVDQFTSALLQITDTICKGGSPVCMLRLENVERISGENRRAIHGGNGSHSGLLGLIEVLAKRIEHVEEAQENLSKILSGMAVAILLTLIGVVLNIVIATR